MLSLRVLGFCVLSTLSPIAIGCSAASAETEEDATSDDQAISAKDRSAANKLLEEATSGAENRLAGATCDEGATVSNILDKLAAAVEKQPTKSFRKKVAASKPIASAVGHTLDYHFLVGTITLESGAVLGIKNAVADASSGIELYGPSTAKLGNVTKLRLLADGRATFSGRSIEEETGEYIWTDLQWSWSLEETLSGTKLLFGTEAGDATLEVKHDGGAFVFPATTPSDAMTSRPSECTGSR